MNLIQQKIAKAGLLLFAMLLVGTLQLSAQVTRSITGKVVDAEGRPMAGASVTSNDGTTVVTKSDGSFSIGVGDQATSLEISSTGMGTRDIVLARGEGTVGSITMEVEDAQLEEVVVTALGIKREKKALGYAVANVGGGDLQLRPEADVSRILNGQAAGLDVVGSSGLTGSGTNINIRGFSSITGGTEPLWVVDGVPFYTSANTDDASYRTGSSASSRFLDLDPNTIENISVLKGLSATVLYGEAGRNGVILVTTKNGAGSTNLEKARGLSISVSQSVNLTEPAAIPETQSRWGGGFENAKGYTFYSNWGGLADGELLDHIYDRNAEHFANVREQFKGVQYPYKNYNSVKRFFDNVGVASLTSISVSGGNAKTKVSATASYLDDKGFIRTNELQRMNLGIGLTSDIGSGFEISASMNFAKTDYSTPPIAYSSGSGSSYGYSLFGDVMYTPLTVDLMGLPWEDPITKAAVYYRSNNGIQNPRWTLRNVRFEEHVLRTYGNVGITKKLFKDKLTIKYRLGVDITRTDGRGYANRGGASLANAANRNLGYLNTNTRNYQIWDHLWMADYASKFGDFFVGITGGVNFRYISNDYTEANGVDQVIFGLLKLDNFKTYESASLFSESFSNGTFLQATIGFKEAFFLNVGARHTLTSVLESKNNQLLYPSVSLSWLPTTTFKSLQKGDILNYLKLRAGFATSANMPSAYLTRQASLINSRDFVTNSGTVVVTGEASSRLANPDLKPELLTEFEFGLEARLFKNKVFVDFTYFSKTSDEQILSRNLDRSTGYSSQYINAGSLENTGIELNVSYNVFQSKDWNINLSGTFYQYRNKISNLPADIENLLIDGLTNLGNFAQNGQPINVIKGSYFLTSPAGQRIVDKSTGIYQESNDIRVIGDPNPDFKVSGGFEASWKFITLGAKVAYTHGGDIYSVTARAMLGRGLAKETDIDRWQSIVLNGVNKVTVVGSDEVSYVPNATQVDATTAYFYSGFGPSEISIYDASVFRLKEISLTVNVPSKWLKKHLNFVKGIALSAIASNVFYIAPGFPEGYNVDPEVNALGAGRTGRGFDLLTGPSARKYSFSLKINF